MEITPLKTFLKVAALKSFSKAAEELHLTQPAVTQQIKQLERELGQPLIDRIGRTLTLTPAGEILQTYAQQIINLTGQAQETIAQFSNQQGRLTLAAGTTNTIFRLPGILSRYHANHPGVEIRIRNGASALINTLVYENAVDVGLITTIDPSLNLEIIPVFNDRIWLVAPPDYPNIPANTAELEQLPLILFRSGSGFRRFLQNQFNYYHFTPKVSMELESIEAIIHFVQHGLGLAFLPEIAIANEIRQGSLIPVEIPGWDRMIRQTYLIYRKKKYLTWPVKAFLEQLGITPRNE